MFPSKEERTRQYEMKTTGITPHHAALYISGLCSDATPTCIMLVGMPASGKSTLVGLMGCAGINYPVVSTDAMFEEDAARHGKTYDEWSAGRHEVLLGSYLARAEELVRHYIHNNISFIIDQTLLTREHRFGHLIKLIGRNYRKIGVVFEVDEKTRAKRMKKRSEKTGKTVPPERIAEMTKVYVRPTREEGFDEIILIN